MDYLLDKLNIVLVFTENGKHGININKLTDVLSGKSPSVIWPPDIISPGVVDFDNFGLVLSIVDGRFQIETKTIDNKHPEYFIDVIKKCILAANTREVNAFGFNFTIQIQDFKELKEHFQIHLPETLSFSYLPKSLIGLIFEKNKIEYRIEITDSKPSALVQLNVHQPYTKSMAELAEEIEEHFLKAIVNADTLVKELLLND